MLPIAATFDPTALTALDHRLAASWRLAAAELGIAVTAPFELPVGDRVFRYGALVHGFGTPKGLLLRADAEVFHPDSCGPIWAEARAAGFTAANLSPLLCRFDRDEFTTFLNFHHWRGHPACRPPWHVGPTVAYPDLDLYHGS